MRRLIGTGTTDSNGQVTVEYTGVGAGKVQLMADCGDIQSEPYTLYDVLFKDIGTEDDYTAWTNEGYMVVERTNETKLTPTTTTNQATRHLSLTSYTVPFAIEMDLCLTFETGGGSSLLSLRQSSSSKARYTPNGLGLTTGEWVHLRLEVTDETLTAVVDGTRKDGVGHDGTFNRFYFTIPANYNWAIKYRNFIIYPI